MSSRSELPLHHEDHPSVISRNARVGLVLFCVYFAIYVGFLLLNVFAPATMSGTEIPLGSDRFIALGGTNLAVAYGVGLILVAMFLSLVYMRATRSRG